MADPRFFARGGPFRLAELAEICNARIANGDAMSVYEDVAPLQTAGALDVSFLENKLYVGAFTDSAAGVCLVESRFVERAPPAMALLVTDEPYRAYARVAQAFYPETCYTHAPRPGIHAAAHVHEKARLRAGCRIEAGAVIEPGAELGSGVCVGANSFIGPGVVLGDGCWVGPNVTIQFALVGKRCVFHPGARIGQDGFGFAPGSEHLKVPQLGRVVIEDDVDIGANACVDRGTGPDTIIHAGTKIDNMVQVGHNVELGAGCLVAALAGLSGSAKIGSYVMIGGQSGVAGHLSIGDGAQLAAQSGVMRNVDARQTLAGSPARPAKEFWRQLAALKKLVNTKKGG